MSYSEVLEERGDRRVRLVTEEGPEEPYDDGQSPLLRIDLVGYTPRAEHIQVGSLRPTDADEQIEEAARRWGGPNNRDWAKFEKYLRAYHGVTQIETYWSETYWYVTYDSTPWREAVGANAGSASLEEYKAWCEGEVYGYVIEKQVTWHAVNPVTDDPEYAEYPDRTSWEEIPDDGSCWGFYGRGYAEDQAKLAFEDALKPDKGEED